MTRGESQQEEREIAALQLVESIARLTRENEIEGGMSQEEAFETLNDLILQAREITGIDPGHTQYCTECLCHLQTEDSTLCEECQQ